MRELDHYSKTVVSPQRQKFYLGILIIIMPSTAPVLPICMPVKGFGTFDDIFAVKMTDGKYLDNFQEKSSTS